MRRRNSPGSRLLLVLGCTMQSARAVFEQCNTWCNKWTCDQRAECGSCQVCQPSPPPAPLAGINPFANVDFVVPASYTANVMSSVAAAGGSDSALGGQLALAAGIPSAIWLDEIAAIRTKMRPMLEQARRQQRGTGVDALSVFVVYNLPGRDCSAHSSAGELPAGDLDRYESEYISAIEALATEFAEVPKIFVLEPDSLPNVVTNMGMPKCAAVAEDYKSGIALGIRRLGPLGTVYVDAGWSGWIGTWSSGRMAQVLGEVFELAGDAARYVRGFVTNVSNYGSLTAEKAYAAALRQNLAIAGYTNLAYIVDTGRNGVGAATSTWCNPKGQGIGEPPRANPPYAAYADAFFWIKPPGESDGVSNPLAPRFDPKCAEGASWTGAPQAGEWFGEGFVDLVQRASPSLQQAPTYTTAFRPSRPPHPPRPPPSPPKPRPPPTPPEPVSDDDFFDQQREDWNAAYSSSSSNDAERSQPWMRHRSPPPPSPRPPVLIIDASVSPPPSPAAASKSPSSWSIAAFSFVVVLGLWSFMKDRSGGAPTRQAPSNGTRTVAPAAGGKLPPHVKAAAREARYAQVASAQDDDEEDDDDEVLEVEEEEEEVLEVEEEDESESPQPKKGRRKAAEPPAVAAGSDSSDDDNNPVLREAKAMAERIAKAKEREAKAKLQADLEWLDAKVEDLTAKMGRTEDEEIEFAIGQLARRGVDVEAAGWHME